MTQLIEHSADEVCRTTPRSAHWILLPRPWLTSDSLRHRGDHLYVSGTVAFNGQAKQLAYWHRLARVTGSMPR